MTVLRKLFLFYILAGTAYGCAKETASDDKSWKASFDNGYAAMQERDFEQAETRYREALDRAKGFPANDVRLAKIYDALGDVYLAQNNIEDAKRSFTSSYNSYKALWNEHKSGVDNRDYALGLATSALHLANIACDALRLDEAEKLYNEALSVEEAALGSDGLKEQILSGKARLYKSTGRESDAEKINAQISELKALPSVDDTGNMGWRDLNVAANEAFQSGNLQKAEKLFTAGVARGAKPWQIAESMRGLSRIYDQRKEFGRAIKKLEEARRYLRNSDRKVELADNLNSAGFCYLQAKDYPNAERMFVDSLHTVNLKDHTQGTRGKVAYDGLTRLCDEQGRYAEAQKYAQEKLSLTSELWGKSDSRYSEDLLAVAILQAKQKKVAEAEKGFLAVIHMQEDNPTPRYLLAALDAYAKFLRDNKQDSRADSIELKAKNLRAEFE